MAQAKRRSFHGVPTTNSGWESLSLEAIRVASATHLVGREDSQEVAQEALLNLYRLPYEPSSPLAWLRVAIRRLIWRRLDRRRMRDQASAGFLETTRAHDPVAIEDHLALREVHQHLPECAKRVIGLLLEGLSHAEIAERLGCALHQVGPRIARALATARRHSRQMSHAN